MKRLVVLGGGESGVGAAVLAKVKGMSVFLSDMGTIAPKYQSVLNKYEVEWEHVCHSEDRILAADEVVKSPGIPLTAPLIVKLKAKNVPVISEIEFAGRYTNAKMVCITGSNGKTTTTMLTYHILKSAGINVGLAGNVGKSLALQVATGDHDVYVVELSSFQLDNMYDFKANVAVLMNITPDHLDRYDHKMENYVAAKFRIIRNQTESDTFIFWQDDPIISEQLKSLDINAQMLPFSDRDDESLAAFARNDNMVINAGEQWQMPRSELAIQGVHNLYNSMAAALSASTLNIKKDVIRKALQDFQAVEHRLEFVADVNGVRYINDSKATNVNSCYYALGSMTRPTVLILGGKDKGNDYTEIEPLVREKVKAIVCMGKDNAKLLNFFEGKVPVITETHSIKDAVEKCRDLASEGDAVLLSPCCASFDLFKSYEDRGTQFKECVRNL
mgnify:FL=1